ncbi:MAG TPA: hypothetical protein VKR58_06660 [Aquella sp.]|nr:hypothetical protein [Aquella sp.]
MKKFLTLFLLCVFSLVFAERPHGGPNDSCKGHGDKRYPVSSMDYSRLNVDDKNTCVEITSHNISNPSSYYCCSIDPKDRTPY